MDRSIKLIAHQQCSTTKLDYFQNNIKVVLESSLQSVLETHLLWVSDKKLPTSVQHPRTDEEVVYENWICMEYAISFLNIVGFC